ncbi:hypothetical protein RB195_023846 [Necator americanus]|uniref:Reverse transcriptase domain-containing protein n=1 Tax=Necator americanus TaxID=51031 RepID=A0ABR1EKS8_NECAM
MRGLEWDDLGVKGEGRFLHHLRFADDIFLITTSINQAERMLAGFDETCKKIGLQLKLVKTMFIRNGWVFDAHLRSTELIYLSVPAMHIYLSYLGRETNMMNDLTSELGRGKRVAWGAFRSIENVVKRTKNIRLRAHLFNTTVLPALTYALET